MSRNEIIISTRHNNTRENCILNVQDGVQQKLFAVVLYQLNGFLLAYCACSHLAPAIPAILASMCEYWSCALQSKLSCPSPPPEISRCRAFTWIIVVPVNPGSPSEISRPPELSRFHEQRNTCAPGYLGSPRYRTLTYNRPKPTNLLF